MKNESIDVDFNFDNSYAKTMRGFYIHAQGDVAPVPELIKFNRCLSDQLGIDFDGVSEKEIAKIFSGGFVPKGGAPLAQAYAGHQFGSFNPQLGDGRALLLGEVVDKNCVRQDIQLKGAGPTPFSRGGDGKAAIGPVLREYIMSEAMHALGVPTTRALAAVRTGESVERNEGELPGAVLTRVASSHLRVGTFQFFAARGETDKVKQLADYAIHRHFPELKDEGDCYLGLLRAVSGRQATLLAHWMHIGFVHGVINTDNMTISGETIDYGPCAFIDTYDPTAVFSSIDKLGRYAYGSQPIIAKWNLARLAETLLPLIDANNDKAIDAATEELNAFPEQYQSLWVDGMRSKIGLSNAEEGDLHLVNQLYDALDGQNVDFTLFFRRLAMTVEGDNSINHLFDDAGAFDRWRTNWLDRLSRNPMELKERMALMNSVNPIYIPRNHKVEEALQSAEEGADYSLFEKLMSVLERPFEERQGLEEYAVPAPDDFGPYTTFCGT